MNVYVIIVTYNAMKWVDCCLGSLRKSDVPCVPVVIDNLSGDETVSYIREHYPEAHIIENKKNKGFGQANNQGIEWAYKEGATHFFLLNQDAWIEPDTIGKLVRIQDVHRINIVSPVHLNGLGDGLDYGFKRYLSEDKDACAEIVNDMVLKNQNEFYVVKKINAAAWMIDRQTIENIGGFDPIFFLYGEDNNYLERIHYHGCKLAFVPDSIIYHDRIVHGDAKAYNELELRNGLVGSYTNINIALFAITRRRIYWHVKTINLLLKCLFTLRVKDFFAVMSSFVGYLKAWPMILKSRNINKKKGSNWLKLEK